jgi:hypothetical protein
MEVDEENNLSNQDVASVLEEDDDDEMEYGYETVEDIELNSDNDDNENSYLEAEESSENS